MVLLALSVAAFGTERWYAFAASTEMSRELLLQNGDVGFEKLQSVLAVVRMWGGGIAVAYIAQGVISIAAICGVAWTWRGCCDFNVKTALLTNATLLASPHPLDYDLMILIHGLCRSCRGVRGFEISLLTAAWIVPLLSRVIAGVTGIPLGLLLLLTLYGFIFRRAMLDRASSIIGAHRIAEA